MAPTIVIRQATAADSDALRRLAALDSAPAPSGDWLVAEQHGELRAAVAMTGERSIADPFAPTAGLVELLRARREQLLQPSPRRTRQTGTGSLIPFRRLAPASDQR